MEITIDGRRCEARADETVLEVARREDIYIPTFCHHEALEAFNACRVCLVAVEQNGQRALLPSCSLKVEEGMEVETDAEDVARTRKVVLELLLARCPEVEKVRELAAEYGVTEPEFEVTDAQEDCILCGLCVRVCDELIGAQALAFSQRGTDTVVETPFEEPSDVCIGCGACAEVCPTGHITVEDQADGTREIVPFHTSHTLVPCPRCGTGYVTEKQLEFLEEQLGEKSDILASCPQCREKEQAGRLHDLYEKMAPIESQREEI